MNEQCQAYYVLEGDMRCTAARGHAGPHCYECPPCAELLARLETATAALARMTEDLADLNTENHRLIARAAGKARAEQRAARLEAVLRKARVFLNELYEFGLDEPGAWAESFSQFTDALGDVEASAPATPHGEVQG